MNILNSNDYKRGYTNGYNDGFENKDKSFFKSGLSIKFALHGSNAIDTYNKGYNEGYEKGSYDRLSKEKPQKVEITNTNNFFSNTNNSNNNFMQDLQLQLEQLNALLYFLQFFNDEMKSKLADYKYRLDALHQSGLTINAYNNFQNNHIPELEHYIKQIETLIKEKSIPLTQSNIQFTTDLIIRNNQY